MIENQIDWNDIWKEQMAGHNEMSGGMDCASYWDDEKEARNYWKMMKEQSDLIEPRCRHITPEIASFVQTLLLFCRSRTDIAKIFSPGLVKSSSDDCKRI